MSRGKRVIAGVSTPRHPRVAAFDVTLAEKLPVQHNKTCRTRPVRDTSVERECQIVRGVRVK